MTRRRRDELGFTLVELLVVMLILGVVGAATTGVVISTLRTEQLQSEMQQVMDDGRISLQRIRKELRAARQVFESSCHPTGDCTPSDRLHFWVDQNQDGQRTSDEVVCYLTEPIGATGTQFQLVRWTQDQAPTAAYPAGEFGCSESLRPSTGAQVVARTLVADHTTAAGDVAAPFREFDPDPTEDPTDPATRSVRIRLRLEVETGRDFRHLDVESIVRLRNVA